MEPKELAEMTIKLKRVAMELVSFWRSGAGKWYNLTHDDASAKMFFRMRFRLIRQFADGEQMTVPKEAFSIPFSELDEVRSLLESMANAARAAMRRGMMRPGAPMQQAQGPQAQQAQQMQPQQAQQMPQQGQSQAQAAQISPPQQIPQQQARAQPQAQAQAQPQSQPQPTPLNAANLEKNSQALNKSSQKAAAKASQAPPAPTTAQPPFPFGATSPHGNPAYASKPKDLNLQLPTSRKKPKLTGSQPAQPSQAATPSPQMSKNGSPDMRRAQVQPKPTFVCTDKDCEMTTVEFPTEQALQYHVEEEHIKPKADPLKYVTESAALVLGLDPDGSVRSKDVKMSEVAPAMSLSTSRQGQTPGNMGSTPMSQDGTVMKRSASALQQEIKTGIMQTGATPKTEGSVPMLPVDPWAGSTIDPQTLLQSFGFENGLPNITGEAMMYASLTPNDTPDSAKDSGASEPNSDISDTAALEIDVNWRNLETDFAFELQASLNRNLSNEASLDPALLADPSNTLYTDWDDMNTDFSKPYQHDMSYYSMAI
ncbi:hypothetical protein ESCO_000161 [Escovopsis weberi]|uniref:Uncharacterized protein n=1 Tax=Escovopsis weberi TaxID=150374 RepID=A0A0N0RTF3_ESCWE|nr:hypothetical protein ESCO_000161 [Escovopsis weberi]